MDSVNKWLMLAANVGVFVGLIFLVIEVDQANKQAAANAYQERITEIEHARQQFSLSEHLPGIAVKVADSGGLDSLSREEFQRLASWEAARALRMQGQYYQYLEGFLDLDIEVFLTSAAERSGFWSELGIIITDRLFIEAIEPYLDRVEEFKYSEVN